MKGWADNENVMPTYNGGLFNLKNEGNSAICHKKEPWGCYAKQSQKKTAWSHLHGVSKVVIS